MKQVREGLDGEVKSSSMKLVLTVGFIAGAVISVIDNFAFGGEVSPIVIVALLFLSTATFGAIWSRRGLIAALPAWMWIPLAHVAKHILGLPDTLQPNTYPSILMLAAFTFVIAALGISSGALLRRFMT